VKKKPLTENNAQTNLKKYPSKPKNKEKEKGYIHVSPTTLPLLLAKGVLKKKQ